MIEKHLKLTKLIGSMIVSVVVVVIGVYAYMETNYARASDLNAEITERKKSDVEIKKDAIANEIRQMDAKELDGIRLRNWEQLRRKDLERTLRQMSETNKGN